MKRNSQLLSVALLALICQGIDDQSWISASSELVRSGDRVLVSWHVSEDDWDAKDPHMLTEDCTEETDGGAVKQVCHPVLRNGCWVGEYPVGADLSPLEPKHPVYEFTHSEWAIPLTSTAPWKWIPCIFSELQNFTTRKGMSYSDGSFNFTVTNRRQPFQYAIFSGGTLQPTLLAQSSALSFDDAETPMHRHIARTTDPRTMQVSWVSAQPSSSTAQPVVQWGTTSGNLTEATNAVTTTYNPDDLCGSPAQDVGFVDPGYFHTAEIGGSAEGGAEVFYRVGSEAFGWSEQESYVAFDSHRNTTRALLTADMGITYEDHSLYHWQCPRALATATHMRLMGINQDSTIAADLALHLGDISYGTGYLNKWDRFMETIEPLASRMPYMTVKGNHERDWPNSGLEGAFADNKDSGGECGVPTDLRFTMPTAAGEVSQDEGWYAFSDGPVRFVMLTTEHDVSVGSDQYSWLEAELGSVDREATPWVIVTGHRQFYSCAQRNEDIAGPLEPLMLTHRVDLVLNGHIHLAQRTCPMFNSTCVDEKDEFGYAAPVYGVIGHAGMTVSYCLGGEFPTGHWGSFDHGFATLDASLESVVLRFYGDCQKTLQLSCVNDVPPLLHEYTLTMPYPRGY